MLSFWRLAALLSAAARLPTAEDATCSSADGECQQERKLSEGAPRTETFFNSYGTAYVQAEMLHDAVRTTAYRDAILNNRALFEGKVVLDVGAGTGILSFFAAQAGAKRVIAVERSDMAHIARKIAADNKLDGVVEVVHGLLEDLELPKDSVDIIVSEWIGTFLIHESMLDSVIFARDRWLRPGGHILPDTATLLIAGMDDQFTELEGWQNFYGLNFSALGEAWRGVGAQQCAVRNALVTKPVVLLDLNLYEMEVSEQEFARQFRFEASLEKDSEVHAFAAWFTCGFFNISRSSVPEGVEAVVSELTTHPNAECTHWQQTFFFPPRGVPLSAGDSVDGKLKVQRVPSSPRDLNVSIEFGQHLSDNFVIVGAEY